jgi:hypothetical protein
LYRFADTVGDGSGQTSIIGADYSSNPTPFMLKPPANEIWRLERMVIHIQDSRNPSVEEYGGGAALTNGMLFRVTKDDGATVVLDLTSGKPVKSNGHYGRHCYDVSFLTPGSGDNMVQGRWTFGKSGRPLDISGFDGERFEVMAQDDFSASQYVDHSFNLQGFVVKRS